MRRFDLERRRGESFVHQDLANASQLVYIFLHFLMKFLGRRQLSLGFAFVCSQFLNYSFSCALVLPAKELSDKDRVQLLGLPLFLNLDRSSGRLSFVPFLHLLEIKLRHFCLRARLACRVQSSLLWL